MATIERFQRGGKCSSEFATAGASTAFAGFVAFGLGAEIANGAGQFADGWAGGGNGRNLPVTPVGALAKPGGPKGDKIGKMADGAVGVAGGGIQAFGNASYFESLNNLIGMGISTYETWHEVVTLHDPGTSSSTIGINSKSEKEIVVSGTPPVDTTLTLSFWATAFPESALARFAPSSLPYGAPGTRGAAGLGTPNLIFTGLSGPALDNGAENRRRNQP